MSDRASVRSYVLSRDVPTVFRGMIDDWKILSWSLESWTSVFGDAMLPFRCGVNQCSSSPRWERHCEAKYMTMSDFFEMAKSDQSPQNEWYYFDYKYLHEWLKDTESDQASDLKNLSWGNFGFPEQSGLESTLWIGSRGAHTPCHMDTYGCNLVAQIHGSKQWILFPPEERKSLRMSRVPYEESSVYSELNFNSPLDDNIYPQIQNIYSVTLMPGDVLFVPHQWWHYVENLDVSVSINTWLPLPSDEATRADEALVRLLISQLCGDLTSQDAKLILNPNEDDLRTTTIYESLSVVDSCLKNVMSHSITSGTSDSDGRDSPDCKRMRLDSSCSAFSEGSTECVPKCSQEELKDLLKQKCKCLSKQSHVEKVESHRDQVSGSDKLQSKIVTDLKEKPERILLLKRLINAFCNADVISRVKDHLLKE